MKHPRTLISAVAVATLALLALPPYAGRLAHAAGNPHTLPGTVPDPVVKGRAHLLGHHASDALIPIAIALPLRDPQGLASFLQQVNDPTSPQYHHFLSQDAANQAFNPTPDQEQRVVAWLQSNGLAVTQTFPNHLLVDAQGTTAQVERLLQVTLNDYQAKVRGKDRTFYAPANDPIVDASVGDVVQSIAGLDSFPRFTPLTNGTAHSTTPYYPQDFANAYDLNPLWNGGYTGSGQHVGITMWTVPPSDTTLQHFGSVTGAGVATTANGRLKVIPVDGGTTSSVSPDDGEAGMDIEYSGGMAPGATIDYYEAPTDSSGNPTGQGLLDALNKAGTDSNNNLQISNSWGGCEASSASDSWTAAAEQIFATNSATGHNYFFSSGDNGSWCDPTGNGTGTDPYPDYPASSPNVTSVGGTAFGSTINALINGGYPGESTWAYCSTCASGSPEGSGGGYSNIFSRPSWQTGSGLASNGKRGYPDISADADPSTGAYVCYGSSSGCGQFGGTSLASPLWAGMLAVVNQYLVAQGKPTAGFLNPSLYNLGNQSQLYPPFHDITSGSNGAYNAAPGWDAVTGEGSPDLYNIARDIAAGGSNGWSVALSANTGSVAAGQAMTLTATTNQSLNGNRLYIIDQGSWTVWAMCTSGTTCSAYPSYGSAGSHTFIAEVTDPSGGVAYATSSPVTVTWTAMPWSVSLQASATSVKAGQSVTLTGTANQSLNGNRLYLIDQGSWTVWAICTSGTTCSATPSYSPAGSHTFIAEVTDPTGGTAYATSSPVTVTWTTPVTWTVSLKSNATSVLRGQAVTLTATASQSLGGNRLYIIDQGSWTVWAMCTSGMTCSAYPSYSTAGTHSFIAEVTDPSGGTAYATSSAVSISWR